MRNAQFACGWIEPAKKGLPSSATHAEMSHEANTPTSHAFQVYHFVFSKSKIKIQNPPPPGRLGAPAFHELSMHRHAWQVIGRWLATGMFKASMSPEHALEKLNIVEHYYIMFSNAQRLTGKRVLDFASGSAKKILKRMCSGVIASNVHFDGFILQS